MITIKWYSKFLGKDELNKYKERLDNCYNSIKQATSTSIQLEIVYPLCPLFSEQSSNKTSGPLPAQKKKVIAKLPIAIILSLLIPIALVFIYSWLLNWLNIQFSTVSTFIGSSVSAIVSACVTLKVNSRK